MNYVKAKTNMTQQNNKCCMYEDNHETVNHISEWNKLAQKNTMTNMSAEER